MNASIRQFNQIDLDAVMRVWERANAFAHPFLIEAFVNRVRRDIPNVYIPHADVWVADKDGDVVGFMALIDKQVGAIFVDPGCHRCNIGTALIDHALTLHDELSLEVFVKNHVGRRFYAKYGFWEVEQRYHQPSGEQVLLLKVAASDA